MKLIEDMLSEKLCTRYRLILHWGLLVAHTSRVSKAYSPIDSYRQGCCSLRMPIHPGTTMMEQEAEEGGREAEEDLRSLVRQRESEIESLTRRSVSTGVAPARYRCFCFKGKRKAMGSLEERITGKFRQMPTH